MLVETNQLVTKQALEQYLSTDLDFGPSARLAEAMRYSLLGGGKRLRALLCFAVYEACGGTDPKKILPVGAALECVHAMSLIHDDLPCMDDDELRRGKPTCHRAFDEATALLAGDALLVLSFELLAGLPEENLAFTASQKIELLLFLSKAVGARGMTAGQMEDLELTGKAESTCLDQLKVLHALKTGALIEASVLLGAIAAEASVVQREALREYSQSLGLAFQVADDLLDSSGSTAELGKTSGKDRAQGKSTFPECLGLEASQAYCVELVTAAKAGLQSVGLLTSMLASLADFAIERKS